LVQAGLPAVLLPLAELLLAGDLALLLLLLPPWLPAGRGQHVLAYVSISKRREQDHSSKCRTMQYQCSVYFCRVD
jgi:hypothetical protein